MDFLWLLEGIRTPSMDKIMQVITYFGQELILVGIICFLYWCVNKKLAYQLGFTYFSAGLIVQTLKISFGFPDPGFWIPASMLWKVLFLMLPDIPFQAGIHRAPLLFSFRCLHGPGRNG